MPDAGQVGALLVLRAYWPLGAFGRTGGGWRQLCVPTTGGTLQVTRFKLRTRLALGAVPLRPLQGSLPGQHPILVLLRAGHSWPPGAHPFLSFRIRLEATRKLLAAMVSVEGTLPALGMKLPSTT